MGEIYIMSVFSEDRPGVVSDVTEFIYEYGFNLEGSKMMRLLDEFAIILSFSGSSELNIEDLNKACRRLEREKGVSAYVRPVKKSIIHLSDKYQIKKIHVEGLDHAGIIYKISKYLSDNDINIDNLKSEIVQSPESGTIMYKIDIYIQIPEGKETKSIESGLSSLAEKLNLEIILENEGNS